MERQVRLEELLEIAGDTLRNSVYISQPGSVVSYDPVSQTATVQPRLADVRIDVETGVPTYEPWAPIPNVKVMWPVFGGAVLAGNLKPYDSVTLMAWDLDPSLVTDASTSTVNPVDVRRLGGNYWRAVPEGFAVPIPSQEANAAASGLLLGLVGDPAQIRYSPGSILVGATATNYVALANLVDAIISTVVSQFNSHTHTSAAPGSPTTPPVVPIPSQGSTAATVVKAL